jgi:hypothetical protein
MQQIADPNSSLVTDDFIDALATVQTNVVDAIAPRSEKSQTRTDRSRIADRERIDARASVTAQGGSAS